jgi:hypothetical protein
MSGCSPTAVSYANWIVVAGTAFSAGSGTVTYSVTPNPSAATRVGTIQVSDRTFTITQISAPCGYSLHTYGAIFDYLGGNGKIFGSPSALGCTPTNGTTQPTIVTLGALVGPDTNIFTQNYIVTPFESLTGFFVRAAQIVFGGQLFSIKQKSAPLAVTPPPGTPPPINTACGATDVTSLVNVAFSIPQPQPPFDSFWDQALTITNGDTAISGPLYLVLVGEPHRNFFGDVDRGLYPYTPLTTCFSSQGDSLLLVSNYFLPVSQGLQPHQVLHGSITYLVNVGGSIPGTPLYRVLSGAPSK